MINVVQEIVDERADESMGLGRIQLRAVVEPQLAYALGHQFLYLGGTCGYASEPCRNLVAHGGLERTLEHLIHRRPPSPHRLPQHPLPQAPRAPA